VIEGNQAQNTAKHKTMKPKLGLGLYPAMSLRLDQVCPCCGQPYFPSKTWKDQYDAVMLGAEQFAICPVCTQAPTQRVFDSADYRERCLYQIRRLKKLYEQDREAARLNRKNRGH